MTGPFSLFEAHDRRDGSGLARASTPRCRCSRIGSVVVGAGRPPPPFRTVAMTGPEVIVIGQTPPHWRAVLGPVTSSALLEFADRRRFREHFRAGRAIIAVPHPFNFHSPPR